MNLFPVTWFRLVKTICGIANSVVIDLLNACLLNFVYISPYSMHVQNNYGVKEIKLIFIGFIKKIIKLYKFDLFLKLYIQIQSIHLSV